MVSRLSRDSSAAEPRRGRRRRAGRARRGSDRPEWPSGSSGLRFLDGCATLSDAVVAGCRRDRPRTRCTACSSASRPIHGCPAVARLLDVRRLARSAPRDRARRAHPDRRRPRRHRPCRRHRAGRLVGAARAPAAGRRGARRGKHDARPPFRASLIARSAGSDAAGKLLSSRGLTVAGLGGYLGGHLSFRLGAGANHAESVVHLAGLGWHDLCRVAELPDGRPVRRELGYISLLVLRRRLVGQRAVRSLCPPRRPTAPGAYSSPARVSAALPARGTAARSASMTARASTGPRPRGNRRSAAGSPTPAWWRSSRAADRRLR